jgi:hypothetical protein
MEIMSKTEVTTYGPFAVMEGDVDVPEIGEVTMCWVEKDGHPASRFGDIDYANVRAMMLAHAAARGTSPLSDMDSDFIDIVDRDGRYTILSSSFGGTLLHWVVDSTQPRTMPGSLDEAEAWIAAHKAAR